jgi:hypothetical protein
MHEGIVLQPKEVIDEVTKAIDDSTAELRCLSLEVSSVSRFLQMVTSNLPNPDL